MRIYLNLSFIYHNLFPKILKAMKTTYQKPEMKVTLVSTHHMFCESKTLDKSSQTVSSNDAVLSREQYSLWDDEEEE